MNNEKNMGPVRSSDEARERGRNGGIASGKSRRRKKEVRERLKEALNCAVVNPKVKSMMKQGITPRACGENPDLIIQLTKVLDHPPRMRGKLARTGAREKAVRSPPAHAGKTLFGKPCANFISITPRACGENFLFH